MSHDPKRRDVLHAAVKQAALESILEEELKRCNCWDEGYADAAAAITVIAEYLIREFTIPEHIAKVESELLDELLQLERSIDPSHLDTGTGRAT